MGLKDLWNKMRGADKAARITRIAHQAKDDQRMISLKLDRETKQRVEELAKQEGLTTAEYMQRAIQRMERRLKNDPDEMQAFVKRLGDGWSYKKYADQLVEMAIENIDRW